MLCREPRTIWYPEGHCPYSPPLGFHGPVHYNFYLILYDYYHEDLIKEVQTPLKSDFQLPASSVVLCAFYRVLITCCKNGIIHYFTNHDLPEKFQS